LAINESLWRMLRRTIDERERLVFTGVRNQRHLSNSPCRNHGTRRFVRSGAHWAIAVLFVCVASLQGQAGRPDRTVSIPAETCCFIHGRVDVRQVPQSGLSVIVTNIWSRRRFAALTGTDGAYAIQIPHAAPYRIHLEAAGYAFARRDVAFDSAHPNLQVDFSWTRLPTEDLKNGSKDVSNFWPSAILSPVSVSATSMLPAPVNTGGNSGAQVPAFIGDYGFSGDTFSVNGQAPIVNPFFQLGDLMRQYFEDGHELETISMDPDSEIPELGSIGEAQATQATAAAYRQIVTGRPIEQIHGIVYWNGGNSALNADPYVLAGQPLGNPRYSTNFYGAMAEGHPFFPFLTKPRQRDALAVSFNGQSSRQLVNDFGVVPNQQERQGDFSGLLGPTGQQIAIYSPRTHRPYPNNVINDPLNPEALALLAYLPQADLQSSGINYRLLTTQGIRNNVIGASYQHQFGSLSSNDLALQQNVYANFNYGEIANDVVNLFPILGGSQKIDGYSVIAGYKISQGHWIASFSGLSSRNDARLTNFFTNREDIETELGLLQIGLNGEPGPINTNPMNYGMPNLVFNNFTGFSATQPNFQLTQKTGVTALAAWIHGRHTIRFGGDLNRVEFNIFGGTNATGTYVFSGGYTEDPNTLGEEAPPSGSSLADLLTGHPQQTRIESAAQKAYTRQTNYDLYIRDDWQVLPNLTLLAGLRYDYYAPFTETTNRLSTLDYASDFSNVEPVQPNGLGPLSGEIYPRSLIRPDRKNFSPHFGFAFREGKNTTVRSGYGINYTEAQYATFIQNLAYQPPFAHVEANVNIVDFLDIATLKYGFGNLADSGNYAIRRNYRVPYTQSWYIDVQQSLPLDLVLDVGYAGAKGTRLDIISAPGYFNNQPFASAYFDFEDSSAFSNFNSLVVRVNKRMRDGIALEATYAYAHSIDNASSIEAGSMTVAQNWQNLLAEESNSSFDIRHELTASFLYQLPLGRGTPHWNGSRWLAAAAGDWTISGFLTVATGFPLTPFIAASVPEVERGTHGNVRPNRVAGTSIQAGGRNLTHWFNPNAFSSDFAPNQQFGTASRYSIPGPGTEAINVSLSRIFNFEGSRSLELRGTASNAFNVVQYSGVNTQISSSTFGYVDAVQPMRQFVFLARFRF
jgi:trimeric autotransporter adhesin